MLRARGKERLAPQPGLDALPELLDEGRHGGHEIRLEVEGEPVRLPAGLDLTAYRIVQEGLTNARKHAPDADVSVSVCASPGDGLTVEIRNPSPARATTAIPGAGTGIIGLAERASLAGGRLEHGHTPAGEFRLWAWLPWPA